jgi:catechol 2,3-dioxygenase-like lactoylglutathione lyase family enzyme
MIRLIQFIPGSHRFIREQTKSWDVGIFDIDFLVDDMQRRYEELHAKGYEFSGPVQWTVPNENRTIRTARCHGPDGVNVILFRDSAHEAGNPPPAYSEVDTSAQAVGNMEEAVTFYRDMLGLTVLSQREVTNPGLDELLGLPPGSRFQTVQLTGAQNTMGKVVLVQFPGLHGRELASIARPPNIGLFMLSFAVEDVKGLYEVFQKNHVEVIAAPTEIEFPLSGKTHVMTARSPNGVMLEFFQEDAPRRAR